MQAGDDLINRYFCNFLFYFYMKLRNANNDSKWNKNCFCFILNFIICGSLVGFEKDWFCVYLFSVWWLFTLTNTSLTNKRVSAVTKVVENCACQIRKRKNERKLSKNSFVLDLFIFCSELWLLPFIKPEKSDFATS